MDDDIPAPEYYDNEWDIAGAKIRKSSHRNPAGAGIAGASEEYNRSAAFLAPIGAWISGYLSH